MCRNRKSVKEVLENQDNYGNEFDEFLVFNITVDEKRNSESLEIIKKMVKNLPGTQK